MEDQCKASNLIIHKGLFGENYNVDDSNKMVNNGIVYMIIQKLGKNEELIVNVTDCKGQDLCYANNRQRIVRDLAGYQRRNTLMAI